MKEKEEALPVYIALKALAKFVEECDHQLCDDTEEAIEREYKLKIPLQKSYLTVHLTTMPEFTRDLERIWDEKFDSDIEEEEEDIGILLNHEFIPEGTIIFFKNINYHQLLGLKEKSDRNISASAISKIEKQTQNRGFPVIILQTTRPKGQLMIEQFKQEKGINNVLFSIIHEPTEETEYDLGILQTKADNFYLFGQFPYDNYLESPRTAIGLWKNNVAHFNDYCGVIIAMGATGASRGNPQDRDFMYMFYSQLNE